jgi:hypothetical protein
VSSSEGMSKQSFDLGCDIDYIPVGYACVLQPIDAGYNAPLKCHVKNLHSEWCIAHYENLGPNDKFPIPEKSDIIDWVQKEIDPIVICNDKFLHNFLCRNLGLVPVLTKYTV